jgi:hypothetical protein
MMRQNHLFSFDGKIPVGCERVSQCRAHRLTQIGEQNGDLHQCNDGSEQELGRHPHLHAVSTLTLRVGARIVPERLSCFRRASVGEYPLSQVSFARKIPRGTYKDGSPFDTPVTLIL